MLLNLFKSKPKLNELIPKDFVDIHSHILPGIDDGAKDIEESVKLISKMKKMGFCKIIGTPHSYPGIYDNTNNGIKKAFEKIKSIDIGDIELDFASEYMIENDLIKKAKNKNLLCIKDNYVLIEMSFISQPYGLYEIIFEIKMNGYIPVLAHPERYIYIHNLDEYYKLQKSGCLFQANLLSATDYYGVRVRKNLDRLLKNKLIDFVGSDIHHSQHLLAFERKVNIKEILELENAIKKTVLKFR